MQRSRTMLNIGSERVRAKYGYACSAAMDQLHDLESRAAAFAPEQQITVTAFELPQGVRMSMRDENTPRPRLGRHYSAVVIGGGQAGLSMSYELKRLGVDHVVLEKHRIAHEWRERRWDTFCLVTPNWQCRLPGFPYHGPDPHGFMVKDEIVRYVEDYARSFGPPLIEGVSVDGAAPRSARAGSRWRRRRAPATPTRWSSRPAGTTSRRFPRLAERLPDELMQLHARPTATPPCCRRAT